MRIDRTLICCTFLFCAATAHGDTLADVKRSLAALPGRQPIHALIDVTRSRHSHGHFINDDFDGSASVDVIADPATTRVSFQRSLLHRSEGNRPVAMTLNEVTGPSIENTVDFAPIVQRLISKARVVEEHATMYENRPARKLRLELPPGLIDDFDDAAAPKTTADTITLWVGTGSTPVAATRVRKGTAGVLFVHVDTVRTQTWRFSSFGDHLVAMRFEDRSVVTGSIQQGDAATVWTVREVGQ